MNEGRQPTQKELERKARFEEMLAVQGYQERALLAGIVQANIQGFLL